MVTYTVYVTVYVFLFYIIIGRDFFDRICVRSNSDFEMRMKKKV